MKSSISYGTTLLCFITVVFITQVHPQCNSRPVKKIFLTPSCCKKVSNATIGVSVDACFEQKENMFVNCKIHAYILTKDKNAWCVDPRAQWLPDRLKKLEARGICCTALIIPEALY